MTIEQNFILQVVSDHLNKRKTERPCNNIDWKVVYQYTHKHQLEGILYYQCKAFAPDASKLQAMYSSTMFHYVNRKHFMKKLREQLSTSWFTIKGISVAEFYPIPALRTMGDTDIVVHTEDLEKVDNVMMELGCGNDAKPANHEWVYFKNDMEFEVHDRLVYNQVINQSAHEQYFNDFWKYVKDGELDWNFHYLFLILHLRKHLMNSGVGFRQFVDLAVVACNNSNLNWDWIQSELKKLELLNFASVCTALISRWFGVILPIPEKKLTEEFYESATAKIFEDGIFGFDNLDNKKASAVNVARAGRNAFAVAFNKILPSYKTLISIPQYRFLRKRPFLLPVAWLYRIIRGIRRKKIDEAMQLVVESFASNEDIQKRSNMLEQWGL